ncbi:MULTISPECIES: hypothetical protein [unclassified Paenibacillus]|uniref:Uncharacterized protein n=1 Tax=Paenibacillus provencensis TaxID=441151 RepID=A0ABW3Q9T9_9BACL|nr:MULTISPECIES: hypothetical protein [unclassified Paenibacillus]MCM3130634.1 hypothetical protein [Paenibacillus sp. MER 78]SDX73962.1 hypothetical protein SAMN05518848_11335 [Paenibacillus sp. PDC88]SFS89564.1 hypothetical protein SAMN04488601_106155 [Paenibacillus sp. 453mf]
MTTPTHPMILAYEIFYFEAGKTYYLPGSKQRILLTDSEYDIKIEELRHKEIQYMLLYDYMFALKKDKWEAVPSSINMDEVEFYYELSIINEEEYMLIKYLYSEYTKPKG